jgi:transglutaminase-like putative cysteine protease
MAPTPDTPTAATLAPTAQIDSDHPAVADFAQRHAVGETQRERAVALYYAVRDGFRYDPYRIDLSPAGMRASHVLQIGIPARLGYADVRNHLSTERLRRTMGTDLFVWHGYVEMWIDGRWVKSTPAFNIELCDRFGLLPLDFDGVADSLYHPYDKSGQRHMEYVHDHGSFDDMPLQRIIDDFRRHYRGLGAADGASGLAQADFAADVARETAAGPSS